MSTLGVSYNISSDITPNSAVVFAQWIGAANVIRNRKIRETNFPSEATQAYSHLKNDLPFLKKIPPQILRNAASSLKSDYIAVEKGLRKSPKIKKKYKKRSAIITNELFEKKFIDNENTLITIFSSCNKNKRPLFTKKINLNCDKVGNQLRISRQGRIFSLSFSFDDQIKRLSNDQLIDELVNLSVDELQNNTIGIDRNVANAAYLSSNKVYAYSLSERDKLKILNRKRAHYQRILAKKKTQHINNVQRQKLKAKNKKQDNQTLSLENHFIGKNQQQLQHKISKINHKIANIRKNANHHWSKDIAENAPSLVVFEALKIKNMTKKAKAKREGRGYAKNKQSSKKGLNRSILNNAPSRIATLTKYKLNLLGKAWIDVNPAYTSKICHNCGSKHTKRPKQETFICFNCGTIVNADLNAALNIKERGIHDLKDGTFLNKRKTSKKISVRKNKIVEAEST